MAHLTRRAFAGIALAGAVCSGLPARATPSDVAALTAAMNARAATNPNTTILAGWIDGSARGTIVTAGPAAGAAVSVGAGSAGVASAGAASVGAASAAGASGGAGYDARTRFEIGSVTKTFTTALLATMVLRHEVALDTTVGALLPNGVSVPAATAAITLEQLATQTSSLPRLPANIHPANINDPYTDYTLANMWTFLHDYTLPRAPGATYEYSNFGIALLGQLLAARAHDSFAHLLTARVLAPLGMRSTSLDDETPLRAATPHDADGRVTLAWHDAAFAPAGALRSTLADMVRYLDANMDTGSRPIGAALLLAQTPRTRGAAGNQIGLAWNTTADGTLVWHNGATGGFWTFIAFDRPAHRGIVLMTNGFQSIDDIAWHFLDPARPLKIPKADVAFSNDALETLPGTYAAGALTVIVRRDDRQLTIAQPNAADAVLHASASGDYFLRADATRFSAVRDARGVVTGLVATSGTTSTTLTRR